VRRDPAWPHHALACSRHKSGNVTGPRCDGEQRMHPQRAPRTDADPQRGTLARSVEPSTVWVVTDETLQNKVFAYTVAAAATTTTAILQQIF